MSEEGRIRRKKLNVFLLEEEHEVLCMKAEEAGMSKSEYIRNTILYGAAHKMTNFSRDYQKEIMTELSRIGNNINQFVRVANSTKTVGKDELEGIEAALAEMNMLYFSKLEG